MLAIVKVETQAEDKEPGTTYHMKKIFDFSRLPMPIKGDEIDIDNVFVMVEKRTITPDSPEEAGVELHVSVDNTDFEEMRAVGGWQYE